MAFQLEHMLSISASVTIAVVALLTVLFVAFSSKVPTGLVGPVGPKGPLGPLGPPGPIANTYYFLNNTPGTIECSKQKNYIVDGTLTGKVGSNSALKISDGICYEIEIDLYCTESTVTGDPLDMIFVFYLSSEHIGGILMKTVAKSSSVKFKTLLYFSGSYSAGWAVRANMQYIFNRNETDDYAIRFNESIHELVSKGEMQQLTVDCILMTDSTAKQSFLRQSVKIQLVG